MTHITLRALASIVAILYTSSSYAVLAGTPAAAATNPLFKNIQDNNAVTSTAAATRTSAASNIPTTTTTTRAAAGITVPANNGIALNPDGSGINTGAGASGENLISPAQLSLHPANGALNLAAIRRPPPGVFTPAGGLPTPPRYLTVRIANRLARPVSTTHARNWDSPTAVKGVGPPGTIAASATASFVVPTDWAGMVAVGEARWGTPRDASLIEANFVAVKDYGMAVATVDISYVDAFTVPIVCSCSGRVVTGCNKGLWGLNTCPDKASYGACANPTRAFPEGTTALPFFAPCRAAAYTFAKDDLATSWGDCQSGVIKCCVGKRCAPNPEQPARRDPSAVMSDEPEEEEEGEEEDDEKDGDV